MMVHAIIDNVTFKFLQTMMLLDLIDIKDAPLPPTGAPYKDFTPRDSRPYHRRGIYILE